MLITLLLLLWIFVSLFLILIILLQRGKGGGLAGALGGAGGSSAFGTKAGDVFTRITVGVFGFWLLLAMILVWSMKSPTKFPGGMATGKGAKGTKAPGTEVSDSTKKENDELTKKLDELMKGKGTETNEAAKKPEVPTPPPAKTGTDATTPQPEPKKEDATKKDQPKTEAAKTPPTDATKKDAPKTDAKTPAPSDTKPSTPPIKGDGKKS